ncbi:hypothetical protein [Flavobacterium suzhouense]|uniref:CarboxypepD_reg-like domain-containing protein n=1 Tax=Flavobacterium suzhouense TaxID=1529638 RepID=A0ABW5NR36_9FLAO
MKAKFLFFLFLLIPLIGFAQKQPRQILAGRVVADSLNVENLSVQNITSNIKAITDGNGDFTIYARPTDTLLFSGIAVREAKLVLKKEHFTGRRLVIELNVDVTVLDEVVIKANALTGDLESDSKNTKTKNITGGMNSTGLIASDPTIRPIANPNTALPSNVLGSPLTGVNFNEVYKMIFKKKKRTDKGEIYGNSSAKNFSENVKERYTHHFFTNMLKIPNDEIGLFLAYCDKGKETAWMLEPKYEFELTDYLVNQSSEYLKKGK